jgi:hypothetical protein
MCPDQACLNHATIAVRHRPHAILLATGIRNTVAGLAGEQAQSNPHQQPNDIRRRDATGAFPGDLLLFIF